MLNGLFIAFVNTILLILLIIVGIFGFLATTYTIAFIVVLVKKIVTQNKGE